MNWKKLPVNTLPGIATAGIAVEFYNKAAGSKLAAVAAKAGKGEKETAGVLAGVLSGAADNVTSDWFGLHWADVAVFLTAAAILTALGWGFIDAPAGAPPPGATALSGEMLVLPVQQAPSFDGRKFPLDVALVFSSRRGAAAGAVFRAKLLEGMPSGNPPVFRFRFAEKDLAEVAKWTGSSEVSIALAVP